MFACSRKILRFESENHATLSAATSKWRPLGILTETSWLCPAASLLKRGRSAHRLLVNPISFLSWYSFLFSFVRHQSFPPSVLTISMHLHVIWSRWPRMSCRALKIGYDCGALPEFSSFHTHPAAVDYLQGFFFYFLFPCFFTILHPSPSCSSSICLPPSVHICISQVHSPLW